jgi:hypothetical protein
MPKTAKKPAPTKKSAKPVAKSTKKTAPKVKLAITETKKGDKKSEKIELKAELVAGAPNAEEEDEDEAPASCGASSAGLAMAAATVDSAAGSLKNFRSHPDIENFYRFIFENDLRYEALEIIDRMAAQGATAASIKAAKSKAN